jgi:uncharacterized protein YndB with AHSA1/START domain
MIRLLLIAFALFAAPALAEPAMQSKRVAESDDTLTLVHELIVEAPAAEVWQAISTAGGWESWAVPVAWSDPNDPDIIETSYDPAARPGQPQTIRQRVLARIPGRMLALRTIKAPAGFADFEQFADMLSVFELEAVGPDRTRVRLTGVGYPDNAAGRRLLEFFEQGNSATLDMLRRRFTEGPVDWSKELSKIAP